MEHKQFCLKFVFDSLISRISHDIFWSQKRRSSFPEYIFSSQNTLKGNGPLNVEVHLGSSLRPISLSPLPLKPPSVVHPPTQIQQLTSGSSHCGSAVMDLTSIHGDASLIPGLAQWSKDPALPWMWVVDVVWILCSRPGAAAPIWPPAWELPYSTCVALKSNKKQINNKQKNFTSALMLPMLSPLVLYIWPLPFDAEDAGLYLGVLQLLQAHVLAS